MDLKLLSPTPPSGLNDSFGTSNLSSDSGIALSTPRYFTPRGTSIDCRNLPRTSDLVAKFEKNIQEYHNTKEVVKSPSARIRSVSKSGLPPRADSFSLKQRQVLYSPRSDNETEPVRIRRETNLRLRQDKPEHFDWETKRLSSGLRIACPTAKSALFSGANRPCVSPFSFQPDDILSSPRSQYVETSPTSDFNEINSDNLALSSPIIVKPPRMAPITVVTSASNSHIPNMIMGSDGSTSHGINSKSMQKCYYSSTDSGAETMTSFSNHGSLHSTPNSLSTDHSLTVLPASERLIDIPTNRRLMEVPANRRPLNLASNQKSNVPRPTSISNAEIEDTQQSRTYRSSVTRSYSAKKVLSSSTDITERGQGELQQEQLKTPKSLKAPTKVIRKTRLSNLAFCGLSKSCTKTTTKIRDPYIPSPSQAPSTPIAKPFRIHRISGFESSDVESLDTSLNCSRNSNYTDAMHSPVRVVSAPVSELKYPKTVPPKKPIRATIIRPVRYHQDDDQHVEVSQTNSPATQVPEPKMCFASDFEIESNVSIDKRTDRDSITATMTSDDIRKAMKSLSVRSDDNLSSATGDDECELSSLAESFSSRDNSELSRSMSSRPSNLFPQSSSHKQHKSLSLSSQSSSTQRPVIRPQNLMTPTIETAANTPQTATLVPNGIVLDEETFQRTMSDLNEMKVLLGTLMKSLQTNPMTSHQCDSPLEEGLREDIYRRFTAQIRATLYQDASTQTACNDGAEIPGPETENQSCVEPLSE